MDSVDGSFEVVSCQLVSFHQMNVPVSPFSHLLIDTSQLAVLFIHLRSHIFVEGPSEIIKLITNFRMICYSYFYYLSCTYEFVEPTLGRIIKSIESFPQRIHTRRVMRRFRIELQVALFVLIIATAVITAGILAYKSMSQIVTSIHQEAKPDNRLFIMKDLNNDLSSLENTVRLYVLSDEEEELYLLDTLLIQITQKLELIRTLPFVGSDDIALTDSIGTLALEKQELWQEILSLHLTCKESGPTFSDIYSKLEQQDMDTLTTVRKKKGFIRRVFSRKKTTTDTAYVARSLDRNEIKEEVQSLENEIEKKGDSERNIMALESQMIEKNILITARLNDLIAKADKRKADELTAKSLEVDRLARMTYKQLAAWSATAVLLLLAALFVLFNYLRKSRAYQKALRDAREKAENLAHAKEQFAANVSHELRTPVNAIAGLTELALQRKMDDETKELVTIISKSSQHLKNIINDTLDFSKIEAKKIVLESVDFSPGEICNEVLSIENYEARKKGIGLHFHQEGVIPEALLGDPVRLKQILLNLVGNAVKFTDEGSVSLHLSAREAGRNKVRLGVVVEDTGIGMSEKDLKAVFEEFVQAKNGSGKKQPGTGLGLTIVKKLVELQGGKINIKSEPGKGTRVIFDIPYRTGDPQYIRRDEPDAALIPAALQQLSILVADDDEYNTFLLRNIFRKWGISFAEAKNGREALEAAANHFFDVILMDIHMPEMNGPEAAKIIKSQFPQVRIIAVTATNDPGDREECLHAGMSQMLIKPFSAKELLDSLLLGVTAEQAISPEQAEKEVLQPPANIRELEYLTNGDHQFLREMILLFISSTSKAMDEIQNAINNGEMNGVFENAHKIAASCKQIQAQKLYALVKQLEEESRKGEQMETVIPLFRAVHSEMAEVHAYLKKTMEETQP